MLHNLKSEKLAGCIIFLIIAGLLTIMILMDHPSAALDISDTISTESESHDSISPMETKEVESTSSKVIEETDKEETSSSKVENTSETTIPEEEISIPDTGVVYYDVPISESDQDFIREICESYDFDEELIYKIMNAESSFNPKAVSSTNDHGIMQLNERWYSSYLNIEDGFEYIYKDGFDIYNVKHNVLIAIRELDYWRGVCNSRGYYSTQSMLECYNRGFGYFDNTSRTTYSDNVFSKIVNQL